MPASMISVENLSKRYLVGHRERRGGQASYTALRDVIGQELRNFGRKAGDLMRGRQVVQGDTIEEFWALKDVNFEVREGEVLGIIGRNGAGKSTLLKILSRITEPTNGRVTLRGRVASLLEVGTGFHPELTGRENIYLNGAILGMSRAEIRKKFDEIVAFAEVEKFLDTPVKRYSSGMYVRLAFAVAAHLEPEILVVDEVLAVGDAEFQKKCLGKMDEVARGEGRTVLFVSHNIPAIRTLCSRVLYLREGQLAGDGDANLITNDYLTLAFGGDGEFPKRLNETLTLEAFKLAKQSIASGSPLNLEIRLASKIAARADEIAVLIYSTTGDRVAVIDLRPQGRSLAIHSEHALQIKVDIRRFPLVEGDYNLGIWLNCGDLQSNLFDLTRIRVVPAAHDRGLIPAKYKGFVELDYFIDTSGDRQIGACREGDGSEPTQIASVRL
jgi:lipopolysaccharide transport system ATP-binding protein